MGPKKGRLHLNENIKRMSAIRSGTVIQSIGYILSLNADLNQLLIIR
jgi:hypothetical protein